VKYDGTTVALRVLRLAAVASIFAFGIFARTAGATYATTDDQLADSSPTIIELPPGDADEPSLDEPLLIDPTLPALPLLSEESLPAEPSESEAPPPATLPVESPEPVLDPVPTDPPSPSDATLETQPESPVSEPSLIISEPAVPDPYATEPLSAVPPAPTPAAVFPVVDNLAPSVAAAVPASPQPARQNISAPVVTAVAAPASPAAISQSVATNMAPGAPPAAIAPAVVAPAADTDDQVADAVHSVPVDVSPHVTGITLLDELEEASAGIVATLAVTNRAPASVAVAIEFGRAGGGWAGAIVFNLWLRRQLRERRMSQRRLAALSGVDHSTISRLLTDDRRPSLATATKLAKALRKVHGETDTAAYFDRVPEETLFPARRVEMALRGDELLDDDDVQRLMSAYLQTRRRRQAASSNGSASPDRATALTREASHRL
jgi:transcriptional regulator with XRE-family HTH domain